MAKQGKIFEVESEFKGRGHTIGSGKTKRRKPRKLLPNTENLNDGIGNEHSKNMISRTSF
jgi:hypothetical protein